MGPDMTSKPNLLTAVTILSFGLLIASTGASHAQAGTSCGPTMYRFDNVAPTTGDTLPSVRRQIAWLGLAGKNAECRLRITCVQQSESDEDKRQAARVCRSARTSLLLNWQHAGDKTYNDNLLKEVGLRYIPARGDAPFGTVFIQLLE